MTNLCHRRATPWGMGDSERQEEWCVLAREFTFLRPKFNEMNLNDT
jgi:hypothetical protein